MARLFFAFAFAACVFSAGAVASADPAAAEALFQEGRRLLEARELDAACEKFEASFALDASSGTLLNLGECRARQGRSATAWAHFVAAARLADTQSRADHQREATERARALEGELSYLTIRVLEPVPGLEISRNGERVAPGSLGAKIPVDPGRFVVEATAPGYRPERRELTIAAKNAAEVVEIPRLQPSASVAAPDKPAGLAPVAEAPRAERESKTPAWIAGGVGLAALGVGGVFGAMALSSDASARRACGERTTGCPPRALEEAKSRDREALISTIGVGAGLIGLGVATLLFLSGNDASDSADAKSAQALPDVWVGRASVVAGASGRF